MNRGKGDMSESESENQYLLHRFQIHLTIRITKRSCGVVRSIMSDSRSVDPGSNPGTSTNLTELHTQNSLKRIFVPVVRFYAHRA